MAKDPSKEELLQWIRFTTDLAHDDKKKKWTEEDKQAYQQIRKLIEEKHEKR